MGRNNDHIKSIDINWTSDVLVSSFSWEWGYFLLRQRKIMKLSGMEGDMDLGVVAQ